MERVGRADRHDVGQPFELPEQGFRLIRVQSLRRYLVPQPFLFHRQHLPSVLGATKPETLPDR